MNGGSAARALLLTCAVALRAAAQSLPDTRLEAGYARVDQAGFEPANAVLLALFWRKPTDRWTLLTSANLTYARDSLAAAQGVAAIAVPWQANEHLRTDVGAAAASFSLRSAGRGGNGSGFLRQHYARDRWGAWFGAAAGITERDGRRTGSFAGDMGGWTRWRSLYASASLSRQNSNDWLLLLASGQTTAPRRDAYQLEDWQLVAEARRGPHQVSASWTHRRSVSGADVRVQAIAVNGELQLHDRLAFLASAGRQLSDPLRSLPQANIVTASFRLSFGPQPLPVMQRATIAGAHLIPRAGGGADLEVRVEALDALVLEVAADFSEWKPLPMVREGDEWVVRVSLPPGKYHLGVRANGGPWRAPRNLARVRDDFGGESGLIVIP